MDVNRVQGRGSDVHVIPFCVPPLLLLSCACTDLITGEEVDACQETCEREEECTTCDLVECTKIEGFAQTEVFLILS